MRDPCLLDCNVSLYIFADQLNGLGTSRNQKNVCPEFQSTLADVAQLTFSDIADHWITYQTYLSFQGTGIPDQLMSTN